MIVSPEEKLSIPPNKTKIGLFLIISLGFVAAGFWMLYSPPLNLGSSPALLYLSSVLHYLISLSTIVFFGFGTLVFAFLLFDTKPSLILDAMGIIDNSSAVSVGRIVWQDIEGVSITQVNNQQFLTIHVNCPERYLQRGNLFKRKLNALNNKLYGSPIQIDTNMLSINLEELNNEISRYHNSFLGNDR